VGILGEGVANDVSFSLLGLELLAADTVEEPSALVELLVVLPGEEGGDRSLFASWRSLEAILVMIEIASSEPRSSR